MSCNVVLEKHLREQQVAFHVEHHPLAYTAHGVALSAHIPETKMAKVVMIVADNTLAMLVVPASERVFIPEVAAVLGAHQVRLAGEEEFAHVFPDCEVGAMPPFGNLYGVPVYLDKDLLDNPNITFQAGTHTDIISLGSEDYLRLVNPTVAKFSLKEPSYAP